MHSLFRAFVDALASHLFEANYSFFVETGTGLRASGEDSEAGSRIPNICPARAIRTVVHDFGSTRNSGRTCMVLPFTT